MEGNLSGSVGLPKTHAPVGDACEGKQASSKMTQVSLEPNLACSRWEYSRGQWNLLFNTQFSCNLGPALKIILPRNVLLGIM